MTSLGCFEEGKDGSANGKPCRPARVECDRYGKTPKVIHGDAIANGTANVRLPLVLATKRRKDSAPDDATVARAHPRLLADVSKQNFVAQALEVGNRLVGAHRRGKRQILR